MKLLLAMKRGMALTAAFAVMLSTAGMAEAGDTLAGDGATSAGMAALEDGAAQVEAEGSGNAAQTGEPRSIRFREADAPYEGVWVSFDDGFLLYLPGEWQSFEMTREQSDAGLFFRAGNDAEATGAGEAPMGVAVSYVEADALTRQAELEADLERAGCIDLELLDINGMAAVGFEKPEDGYRGVVFFHAAYPKYVLTVYVTPVGEDGSDERDVGDGILS